jgi:hypothetical protein
MSMCIPQTWLDYSPASSRRNLNRELLNMYTTQEEAARAHMGRPSVRKQQKSKDNGNHAVEVAETARSIASLVTDSNSLEERLSALMSFNSAVSTAASKSLGYSNLATFYQDSIANHIRSLCRATKSIENMENLSTELKKKAQNEEDEALSEIIGDTLTVVIEKHSKKDTSMDVKKSKAHRYALHIVESMFETSDDDSSTEDDDSQFDVDGSDNEEALSSHP